MSMCICVFMRETKTDCVFICIKVEIVANVFKSNYLQID